MADVHSKEVRSYNMSRIRSVDTKPEMLVRRFLFSKGFRYRLHPKNLPGKPDIYLPKYKTVIFIHGCFWHGHTGCKYFVVPKSRTDWWLNKIERNRDHDSKATKLLGEQQLRQIIIWECELKKNSRDETLNKLLLTLQQA